MALSSTAGLEAITRGAPRSLQCNAFQRLLIRSFWPPDSSKWHLFHCLDRQQLQKIGKSVCLIHAQCLQPLLDLPERSRIIVLEYVEVNLSMSTIGDSLASGVRQAPPSRNVMSSRLCLPKLVQQSRLAHACLAIWKWPGLPSWLCRSHPAAGQAPCHGPRKASGAASRYPEPWWRGQSQQLVGLTDSFLPFTSTLPEAGIKVSSVRRRCSPRPESSRMSRAFHPRGQVHRVPIAVYSMVRSSPILLRHQAGV